MPTTPLKSLLLIASFLFALCTHGQEVVKVGVYSLEPILSFDTSPSGTVGSVVHKHLQALKGHTVDYHAYPFARLLSMIERNELDVALLVAKTPEREASFKYSSHLLWVSKPAIVVKVDSSLAAITSLDQLKNKKIGHARGSIIPGELEGLAIKWLFRSEENYFQNAMRSVYLGRLDGFFVPTFSFAKQKLNSIRNSSDYVIVSLPLEGLPLYAIYPKNISESKLAALEAVMQKAHQELTSILP